MSINIVRARKDTAYRQKLSTEKQALLLPNSTREIELTDTDLEAIYGGSGGGIPLVGDLAGKLPLVGKLLGGGGGGDA